MDLSNKQGRREQGQRISAAVERAGLSIEELAGRIGCSRALIYQYLSGTTLAQPDRLQQIANECGVPLAYFYGESSELPTSNSETALQIHNLNAPLDVTSRLQESLRALQELADAQENPPDFRSLASTSERILSFASQIGDRAALTREQNRLGVALNRIGEFPRAADALRIAVARAIEAGDTARETSARQSLGKAYLAMGRIQEAQEQFTRVTTGNDFDGRWKGTLSLGSIHEMRGEYQHAMRRFDEAAAILEEGEAAGLLTKSEADVAMLYIDTNRRNVYMDEGDFRNARLLGEKGLASAEALGNADQHLEARFDIAWCDFYTGHWASAERSFLTTLHLARFVGDQGRETLTRAWHGIFLTAAGDHDTAISEGKDALSKSLSRGDRRSELYSQLALADAYTGQTRRDSEARYHTSQALAVATSLRLERGEIECRLRLARLYSQTGELSELFESASKALQLAQNLGARHLESLARCWMAESLRRGRTKESENVDLQTAREQAQNALVIAEELAICEPAWRAHTALAQIALQLNPSNIAQAEEHLRAAIRILDLLRAELNGASIPDTLLENYDTSDVYARLADLLRDSGRSQEAEAFLDQTGWPPLTASYNAESAQESRQK